MKRFVLAIKSTSPRQLMKYLKAVSHHANQSAQRIKRSPIRVATSIYSNPLFGEVLFVLTLLITFGIGMEVRQ